MFYRSAMLVLACVSMLAFAPACDFFKDKVNETTAQTRIFEEELDDIPLAEVAGVCSPTAVSFNDLMAGIDWWADAKGHIKDVVVDALNYQVPDNDSEAELQLDLYLSDVTDVEDVPDADYIGSTDLLAPGSKVEDWEPMTLASGAEDRLAELILEPDTPFTVCVKIPQVESGDAEESQVDLKLELQIAGFVTFVPLSD